MPVRRSQSENPGLPDFSKLNEKKNCPVYPHFDSTNNALCLIIFNTVWGFQSK